MDNETMIQEMIEMHLRLAAILARYDAGERSSLYGEVRVFADEVVCLIDEAPPDMRSTISRLADRCEALLRTLAN